jgi:hypothetical protein
LATARRPQASIACHWQDSRLSAPLCADVARVTIRVARAANDSRLVDIGSWGNCPPNAATGDFETLGGSICLRVEYCHKEHSEKECDNCTRRAHRGPEMLEQRSAFLVSGHWLALPGNCTHAPSSSMTALGRHHRSSWLRAAPAPHLRCLRQLHGGDWRTSSSCLGADGCRAPCEIPQFLLTSHDFLRGMRFGGTGESQRASCGRSILATGFSSASKRLPRDPGVASTQGRNQSREGRRHGSSGLSRLPCL